MGYHLAIILLQGYQSRLILRRSYLQQSISGNRLCPCFLISPACVFLNKNGLTTEQTKINPTEASNKLSISDLLFAVFVFAHSNERIIDTKNNSSGKAEICTFFMQIIFMPKIQPIFCLSKKHTKSTTTSIDSKKLALNLQNFFRL